jgi:hypothetical protein
MDGTFFGVFAGVLIIGALIMAMMALTKKGGVQLDVDKYRSKWLSIENQLKRDEESSYHLCILNADKLLDQALRERGVKGETMGERMKNAKTAWSNVNAVWVAHKLRNQIAHEPDVRISYDSARLALASFKQGLKDMGAI